MGRGEGEWCGGHAHAVHLDDVLRLKVRQVLEVLHLRDMSRGHVSDDVSPAHVAGPSEGVASFHSREDESGATYDV